jgi:hypothetical protein
MNSRMSRAGNVPTKLRSVSSAISNLQAKIPKSEIDASSSSKRRRSFAFFNSSALPFPGKTDSTWALGCA